MALDPYAQCPAGTGKKLKFCCHDLIGELENIQRMLDGDQRQACLEHIEKLSGKFPGRACLLNTKAMLLAASDRPAEAQAVVDEVLSTAPNNPVALAESALLALPSEGGLRTAVDLLQKAIAASPEIMPGHVYNTLGIIAEALLDCGEIAAARGHLLLQASLAPEDKRALALLMRLTMSPSLPLVFKEEPQFLPAPEGVPWAKDFEAAMEPIRRGAWRVTANRLAALSDLAKDSPAVWHNLAIVRSWLADREGATSALRRYAALDVPADDAIEAEALAQLLDPAELADQIDLLRVTYPILAFDALTERLLSHARAVPAMEEPHAAVEEGEPPPRSIFTLLDRAMPRSGVELRLEDAPLVLGQVYLFGRQTDREARLELQCDRPDLAAAAALLADAAGDALGPAGEPEVVGGIPVVQSSVSWNWRFPDDVPADLVNRLTVEKRRDVLLKVWAHTPRVALDQLTPQQAAGDPKYQRRLAAMLLVLEMSLVDSSWGTALAALRDQLHLPHPTPIDPTVAPIKRLPLARLARVEFDELDDEALLNAYQRATFTTARGALHKIATLMLSRPALHAKVGLANLYGLLAELEGRSSQALAYLDQARAAAEAERESTARWDIQELALRLDRAEMDEAARLIQHLQSQHMREPGVARAVMQVLVEAGIVSPHEQPLSDAVELAGVAEPAAEESSAIWTPGQEAAAGKKSALWTPGME